MRPTTSASTTSAAAVITAALVSFAATPAVAAEGIDQAPEDPAGAVERIDNVFAFAYADAEAGLVALGGPPPEEGCFGEGFDDTGTDQVVTTPSGAVVVLGKDTDQPMQVYAGTSIEDVCDRVVAGEPVELLASGVARLVVTDNDRDVSATRTNSFQNSATGRLRTPAGDSCSFRAAFHGLIDREGEFRELRQEVALRC